MLIDVHGHFYTERSGRTDWEAVNRRRMTCGERVGITHVVASILGTYGFRSPTYFPSPEDVGHANDAMLAIARAHPGRVLGYCLANPNYTDHALREIERRLDQGMVGVKLAASRRATDPLLAPIAELAGERGVPILHHVWQHRRREWPGQEASDSSELCELAARHPRTRFILAHLGGGGDWAHTLRVARDVTNVWVDLSGSGVDRAMLTGALELLGAERLVWGTDLTMDTAAAKLRFIESQGLAPNAVERIRAGNARAIFPAGAFDGD